jgi:hypothetical protein
MALNIKGLYVACTLSISDTVHNNALHYAECCILFSITNAECHYAECRGATQYLFFGFHDVLKGRKYFDTFDIFPIFKKKNE